MHQQIFTFKRGRFVEPTLLDHLYCRWFFVGEQDYKTSMRHDNSNLTAEAHTQCKSWRSDGSPSCLFGFITRVGPGLHPCPLRWRGCGLLTNSTQVSGLNESKRRAEADIAPTWQRSKFQIQGTTQGYSGQSADGVFCTACPMEAETEWTLRISHGEESLNMFFRARGKSR